MTITHRNSAQLPRMRGVKPIRLTYDIPEHQYWPHVVKFSGGRSSAMMLLGLLYGRQLRRSRGDVVVFNNTSAEHPATYAFATTCKRITEERFNIPFFWTEFQTYEDARRGEWRRLPSYRMVKTHRWAKNRPYGYRWHGEVFEELISWKQTLPTRFSRHCTEYLKLNTTVRFLEDWFGRWSSFERKPSMANHRLGHWYRTSQIDPAAYKNRKQIARYHLRQPAVRPLQKFQDYTNATISKVGNRCLVGKAFDGTAQLKGDNHVEFLSLIGLRADEPRRVSRVLARNNVLSDVERRADGEYIYAPLFDAEVDNPQVLDFWGKQNWDLRIPHDTNLSNCVYCFMKGERTIREIAIRDTIDLRKHAVAPDNIAWWADIERRYARVIPARSNPNSSTSFGFFGANRMEYEEIIRTIDIPPRQVAPASLPCDCTD